MAEQAKNWENVKSYSLDPDSEQALFDACLLYTSPSPRDS